MSASAKRALSAFMTKMDKSYGDSVFVLGKQPEPYAVCTTGSILLDRATIVGGHVRGRITEMWGPEDGGKTTLALIALAEAMTADPTTLGGFIDMEHKLDLKWAASIGVPLDRLIVVHPKTAEDVADQMKDMIRSGLFTVVVLDSIGAMISKAEKDKDADEATVGKVPKIVTRMVNICNTDAGETAVIILNQVRSKIGAQKDTGTTPGGWALKHASTLKMKVGTVFGSDLDVQLDGDKVNIGHRIVVRVQRSKVGPAGGTAEIMLFTRAHPDYGDRVGFDPATEAVDLGVEQGVLVQSGAWYALASNATDKFQDATVKFQGKQRMAGYLREHPELVASIRATALEALAALIVNDPDMEPSEVPDDLLTDSELSDERLAAVAARIGETIEVTEVTEVSTNVMARATAYAGDES